jgi:hypothetical protein
LSPQPRRGGRRRNRPQGAVIQRLVQHADASEVSAGYARVRTAAPRLVAAGNRFDGRVPGDASPPVATDAPAYFAAASILHLEDGYSYAGRSIGALLRGDRGCASHLAYYAELRAALALLAANGLLNLNTVVFSLGSNGALLRETPGGGTHNLAWRLLDAWTRRTTALDLLCNALRPFNVPLRDWLDAASVVELAAPAQATAQHWLRAWSLDLRRMDADHIARNRFSYNPTRLYPRAEFASEPFVSQTWSLLEPTPGNPFETFDRHLLRAIVGFLVANTVADAAAQQAEPAEGDPPTLLARTPADALDRYIYSARAFAGQGPWEAFLRRTPPHDHDAALITFAAAPDDNPWSCQGRSKIDPLAPVES